MAGGARVQAPGTEQPSLTQRSGGVPRDGTGHPWAGGCGVGSRSSAPALAAPTDSRPRYQLLPGDFLVTLWSSVGRRGRKTPVSWSTRSPGAGQGNSTGPCTALQTALSLCGAAQGAGAGGTGPARAHAEGRRGRLGPPPLLMGKEEVVVSPVSAAGGWGDAGGKGSVCQGTPGAPRKRVRPMSWQWHPPRKTPSSCPLPQLAARATRLSVTTAAIKRGRKRKPQPLRMPLLMDTPYPRRVPHGDPCHGKPAREGQ